MYSSRFLWKYVIGLYYYYCYCVYWYTDYMGGTEFKCIYHSTHTRPLYTSFGRDPCSIAVGKNGIKMITNGIYSFFFFFVRTTKKTTFKIIKSEYQVSIYLYQVSINTACGFWLWHFLHLSYITLAHSWSQLQMCMGQLFLFVPEYDIFRWNSWLSFLKYTK